jgi:spermidine synthase
MSIEFEELDYQETPLGAISLRRRSEPMVNGQIVYEVKLGDEFLMSSLFTAAEIELARLGLSDVEEPNLDVVVGGLGLGYTAAAALEFPSVRSLLVVEIMEPVIDWHRRGIVPLGETLTSDARCAFFHGDFFEIASSPGPGFSPSTLSGPVHAVLLDIDHSPTHWLNSGSSAFYTESALRNLAGKLHPGGVFGMWSNDPPDGDFSRLLDSVFHSSESHVVTFPNPYTGGESSSTVYLSHTCRE